MPNDQRIPRSLAHTWSETIWNPPYPVLNLTAMVTARARVATATASPASSWNQRPTALAGTSATTAAPTAGSRTSTVRKGKGPELISSTTAWSA